MLPLPLQTYLLILVDLVTRDQEEVIAYLVIQLARENRAWGYRRISDVAKSLGQTVSKTTEATILEAAGIEPAPERRTGMSWSEFLRIHWDAIVSCDFFSVEALTLRGYVRFQVFFVMRIATREVEIAGISPNINGSWMVQMARNLTDAHDGFLLHARYLIHDADPLFTQDFKELLEPPGSAKEPELQSTRRAVCEIDQG